MDKIESLMRSLPAQLEFDDPERGPTTIYLHLQPTRNHKLWNAFYGIVDENGGIPSGYYVEAKTPVEALQELKTRIEMVSQLFAP